MTVDDQTHEDRDLPARPEQVNRSWLDELHRWRWWLLAGFLAALVPYVYYGMPGIVLVGVFVVVFIEAGLLAFVATLLYVLLYEGRTEQRGLLILDPRGKDLGVTVRFWGPEKWRDLDVRWGSLGDPKTTEVPIRVALTYDEEAHAAYGTHRAVMDVLDLERNLWRFDEYYGKLEEEAALVSKFKSVGRTLVRRAVGRRHAEDTAREAEMFLGNDDFGQVWDKYAPSKDDDLLDVDPDAEDESTDARDGADLDGDVDDFDDDELVDELANLLGKGGAGADD